MKEEAMRKVALELGYDGSRYVGWQRQENGMSIQQAIEDAIEKLFHEKVRVMGSGRTDAGVHARGQVAAVELQHTIPVEQLMRALNANLPSDIRIYRAWEAAADFHPRFQAKRKTYAYRFIQAEVMPPEYRRYYTLIRGPLDSQKIKQALRSLEGEHDFAAFRSAGGMNLSTVRRIDKAVLLADGEGQRIEITGNGFLYNMVRIIAGTMFEIGRGKLEPEVVEQALRSKQREILGPTAPPQGLMLMRVEYE